MIPASLISKKRDGNYLSKNELSDFIHGYLTGVVTEEQMAAMGDQMGMFKLQFRPMVWIMVFTIPVFLWIYWKILSGNIDANEVTITVPFVGEADWTEGLVGPIQLWIVWYFMSSMAFTQVIRKALNIRTSPT